MASEAMKNVQSQSKRPATDIESLKRKKFKAEDLPLSAAQHAAIDKLLHSFKKKGGFDTIRKQLWSEFNDGVRSCLYSVDIANILPWMAIAASISLTLYAGAEDHVH